MLTNGWPLMGHPADGLLRAYLDGELPADEKKRISHHLEVCPHCRHRYAIIRADAAWAAARLGALRALVEVAPVPEPKSWAARGSRGSGVSADASAAANPRAGSRSRGSSSASIPNGGFSHLKYKLSPGKIAAAAAALLTAVSLSFPSVRATAAQWMTIFRVDEARVIRITPEDFENVFASEEALESLMGDLAELVQAEALREPVVERGLAEAELQARGFLAPAYLPDGFAAADGVAVGSGEMMLQVDVDGVNELLAALGESQRLPAELKGQVLRLQSGPGFGVVYQRGEELLYTCQFELPTLSGSGDVDLNQIFTTFSGLLGDQFGVPAALREQMSQLDLNRTIPLPLMEGAGTEVMVNGHVGTYHGGAEGGSVVWVKDGTMYAVTGSLDAAALLQIAESIGE